MRRHARNTFRQAIAVTHIENAIDFNTLDDSGNKLPVIQDTCDYERKEYMCMQERQHVFDSLFSIEFKNKHLNVRHDKPHEKMIDARAIKTNFSIYRSALHKFESLLKEKTIHQ